MGGIYQNYVNVGSCVAFEEVFTVFNHVFFSAIVLQRALCGKDSTTKKKIFNHLNCPQHAIYDNKSVDAFLI